MIALFVLLAASIACADEFPDAALKVLVPQTFALPRKGAVDPRTEIKTEVFRVGPIDVAGHSGA